MQNNALVKYRLERARKDLNVAKKEFNDGELEIAANRAYYSIFHSMRAVLALEKKDFRKHSAVIAYFNQYYVNTKIFPSNLFKLIRNASSVREDCDYSDFYTADFDDTKEQVESAELIYNLVEKYINDIISGEK